VLIVVVIVVAFYPSNRAKSQPSGNVSVSTPGLHGQQVTVSATILNKSLTFYAGDKVAIDIALMYTPFPGDPNTVKIVSVNDTDGFTFSSVQPSLPTDLGGNPQGLHLVVVFLAPTTSYSGDLHLNCFFYVPPPPP
jgi:hypothetical protein